MTPAVVKLGGSTAFKTEIQGWIAALAGASLPLVVVPGGGPFADQVRNAQKRMGLSDKAAHAMAILAMDQFGYAVADRHARFVPTSSLVEVAAAIGEGKIPVWLPSPIIIAAPDIPQSWDVTSDSLAAWLAGKLGADKLLLIKQTRDFSGRDSLTDLTSRGILDACFSSMLPSGVDFYLAGPEDALTASAGLAAGQMPGRLIAPAGGRVWKTG